jgi:hypothetical protein
MRHGGSVTVAAGQPGRRNTLRYSALRGLSVNPSFFFFSSFSFAVLC